MQIQILIYICYKNKYLVYFTIIMYVFNTNMLHFQLKKMNKLFFVLIIKNRHFEHFYLNAVNT